MHISEFSVRQPVLVNLLHIRDYFLAQPNKFSWIPGGIKAHSTHVKGIGTYKDGVEKPRINVFLATEISEERCKLINLGYKDHKTINLSDWQDKEDEGIILVHNAGETLYRLN